MDAGNAKEDAEDEEDEENEEAAALAGDMAGESDNE